MRHFHLLLSSPSYIHSHTHITHGKGRIHVFVKAVTLTEHSRKQLPVTFIYLSVNVFVRHLLGYKQHKEAHNVALSIYTRHVSLQIYQQKEGVDMLFNQLKMKSGGCDGAISSFHMVPYCFSS